jgi:guanylate kinase
LVLSAPLGVGKRTLCQALLDRHPDARLSISKTTRPRGPREVEGYDFYFISEPEFKKQIEAGEFLEHVQIHGHAYGTPRTPIAENRSGGPGRDFGCGHRRARVNVKKAVPTPFSFLFPRHSGRLGRATESVGSPAAGICSRPIGHAREEIARATEYDYVVLSDTLVETAEDLSAILRAEHLRAARVRWGIKKSP